MSRGDPEDLGPGELGLGDPDAGLRGGDDQRPGVGEPQGRGQVDREPEVGRLQRRRLQRQADRQGRWARRRQAAAAAGGRARPAARRRRPAPASGRSAAGDGRDAAAGGRRGTGRGRAAGGSASGGGGGRSRPALLHEPLDRGGDRRGRQSATAGVAAASTAGSRARGGGGRGRSPAVWAAHGAARPRRASRASGEDRWPGGASSSWRHPTPSRGSSIAIRGMGCSCRDGARRAGSGRTVSRRGRLEVAAEVVAIRSSRRRTRRSPCRRMPYLMPAAPLRPGPRVTIIVEDLVERGGVVLDPEEDPRRPRDRDRPRAAEVELEAGGDLVRQRVVLLGQDVEDEVLPRLPRSFPVRIGVGRVCPGSLTANPLLASNVCPSRSSRRPGGCCRPGPGTGWRSWTRTWPKGGVRVLLNGSGS